MESSKLKKRKPKGLKRREGEEESIDKDLQRQLLDKLDAYGDSLLEDSPLRRNNKPQNSEKISNSRVMAADTNEEYKAEMHAAHTSPSKPMTSITIQQGDNVSKKAGKRRKQWEIELEEELNIFNKRSITAKVDDVSKRQTSQLDVNTSKKKKNEPEFIVFEERQRKNKELKYISPSGDDNIFDTSKEQLLEISNEVYQFGLSGFQFQDKEKLEMERAVKLGAKPPKKSHINYKEFMQQQKEKREAELKQREIDRKLGFKVAKKQTARDGDDRLLRKCGFWKDPSKKRNFFVDGQIGKFKDGVQILNKEDIFRTTRKNGRRSKKK